MSEPALHQLIIFLYAACNLLRLACYVPQIAAVVRDHTGARAISLTTWYFWAFSHAITAIYSVAINADVLLAGMMWANAAGCLAVATLAHWRRRLSALGSAVRQP